MSDKLVISLITIGSSIVGKTSLIKRFTENKFEEEMISTIGVDFFKKELKINNKNYLIKIWDTCGQERFARMAGGYFKHSNGVLLVYSMIDQISFNDINKWMTLIKENNSNTIPIVLVQNKIDLEKERVIKDEEGQRAANEMKINFYKTSSKTGEGVQQCFMDLINKIIELKELKPNGLKLRKVEKKKGDLCCGKSKKNVESNEVIDNPDKLEKEEDEDN